VRAGINSSIDVRRCYLSDARYSIIHATNPKLLRVEDSTLTRCQREAAVNLLWLTDSDSQEISRIISLKNNSIYENGEQAIRITSTQFSAHNIKVAIEGNKIYRNGKEGIVMGLLAISSLRLVDNEVASNMGTGVWMSSVHQKSNKSNFLMKGCACVHNKNGFGVYLFDTAMVIEDSEMSANKEGGIFIGNCERPTTLVYEAD